MTDPTSHDWAPLGAVHPKELEDARWTAHDAAQALAATAYALLPAPPDHRHSNLLWDPGRKRFVGRELPGGGRAYLDLDDFMVGLLDASGAEVADVDPRGQTLDELYAGMTSALTRAGVPGAEGAKLVTPEYDLPDTPVRRGEPFPMPAAPALEELTHWFHDGALLLEEVSRSKLGGAEVRGWPHHFDLAALLVLDPDADPEEARSVGVGLSPGDGSYDEPYLYISPWPAPAPDALPPLPEGARWHTTGFTSAVVTGTALVEGGDAASQHARALALVEGCVGACLKVLG